MATRKKTAGETYATTTARGTAKNTAKNTFAMESTMESPDDFPAAYIRLRTVLDGLEISALRYCLKNTDTKDRIYRADEIVTMLMPMVRKLQFELAAGNSDPETCEDGFYKCNGCCVPYPCPDKS